MQTHNLSKQEREQERQLQLQKKYPDAALTKYNTVDERRLNYGRHKERIDKATEAAFTNIQWSNFESDPLDEQVIGFNEGTSITMIFILNLIQYPRFLKQGEIGTPYFLWEVKAYLINKQKQKLQREVYWTRNQKKNLRDFSEAILSAVNVKPSSWAMDGQIMKTFVSCTDDDMPVINAAAEQVMKRADEIILAQQPVVENDETEPQELSDRTKSPIKEETDGKLL